LCLPKADTDEVQCKKRQLGAKTLDKANDKGFVPCVAHEMIGIAHSYPNVGKKAYPKNNAQLPCSLSLTHGRYIPQPITNFPRTTSDTHQPDFSRTAYPCSILTGTFGTLVVKVWPTQPLSHIDNNYHKLEPCVSPHAVNIYTASTAR
jgi:hypothetical protein